MPESSDILKRGWVASFMQDEDRIRIYALKRYKGLLGAHAALGSSPDYSSPDDLIQEAFVHVARNKKAFDPARFKPYEFWRRQISHVAKEARARASRATEHITKQKIRIVSADDAGHPAFLGQQTDDAAYARCQREFLDWLSVNHPRLVDVCLAVFNGNEQPSDLAAEFDKSSSWASKVRKELQAACSAFISDSPDAASGPSTKPKEQM